MLSNRKMATIFLSLLTFFRFSTPSSVENSEWKRLDKELKQRLAPLHHLISRCSNPDDLKTLGNQISIEISTFCNENKELFAENLNSHSEKFVSHQNKTIAELELRKKELRKEAFKVDAGPDKRKEFYDTIKAISDLKAKEKYKQDLKTGAFQEKQFNKNKFKFAKEIVKGSFGKEPVKPAFSEQKSNQHYPSTYSHPRQINLPDLHWFPPILTGPEIESFMPFDCSHFRPRDVRSVLANSNKKSAPGPDGVSYSVLHKLDSCHHILATLFTKVLMTGCPPSSWSESVVKLIHKKGDSSDPSNFRMIALSGCIGKTFHLLLNQRLTAYLIQNNLVDPSMQKAFLPGINGCIEHNIAMEEVIKNARKAKRTAHITFFDLEDAFGSVPHSLIQETLKRNHVPENICKYLNSFYNNCQAVVQTPSWRSQLFPFCHGVFQGDPLSPTIFLMVFNPVLLKLKNMEEKFGYKLHSDDKSTSIITLPYADDFCLITFNKRSHQNIINDIFSNINSMGMKLKPSKCRSFSISAGKAQDIPFHIGHNRIPSIRDEEQKFLGCLLFFNGKSEETFKLVYDTLKEALERIESSLIRKEYKLWILKNYLIPSKRFLLTVHTLPQTHLSKLDTFVDKFTKKWAGLPKSATNAVIHMKEALDIPAISAVYMEAHNTSHARTRLQGDSIINTVLDHTLQREASYTHTQHTTTGAEKVFRETLHLNTVAGEIPTFTGEKAKQRTYQFNKKIRTQVRNVTRLGIQERLKSHVESLQVQGSLLALAAKEKEDLLWKSTMFQLKSGTLKFMLNASIDTLPTPANLRRWKFTSSDKCKLCGNRATTNHYLNCCSIMLNTNRYTWRHNNLVNFIVNNVEKKFKVYSDLPGWEAPGGGTIPPALCVTNLKPDIVILDSHTKTVHIYELMVPLTMNIEQRHTEKSLKYAPFITDMTGFTCKVNCFEVSSTGYINDRNRSTLNTLHTFLRKDLKKSTFLSNLNSLAWYGSYQLWLSRMEPEFASPPFLIPHLVGITVESGQVEEEEQLTGSQDTNIRGPGQ